MRRGWPIRQEVMDALEEVVSTMKDAQTGERGYILTGETRYLEPYNSATATIDEKIQRLKRLTADNPRQQARIPPLQQCIQDELDILKRNIALGKERHGGRSAGRDDRRGQEGPGRDSVAGRRDETGGTGSAARATSSDPVPVTK